MISRRTHGAWGGALVFALGVLAGSCAGEPTTGEAAAWFEEVANESGLVFEHRAGHDGRHLFPEVIGGGVALFDMDGDSDLDAYFVQSGALRDPAPDDRNRLFANDGAGRFTDVTAGSGADDAGYGMGVAAGDYDGDGDTDLYVTNYGPNVLLRNEGEGRFADVTTDAGVGDPSWSTSAAFADYDLDGDLDLFVVNYVNWTVGTEQNCYNNTGVLDYCLPTNYNAPAADRLYRNEGDGTFVDVTAASGLQAAFGNGLGVAAGDFDGNGWPDLFVANDTMMNQLWLNLEGPDGRTFVDEALLRGCALDEHGTAKAGMGVAVGDPDDDGDLDLVVVNLASQTDSFFRNRDGFFDDATGTVGLGAVSRRFTRFGVGFADFDNDGVLDLYEANGRVVRAAEFPGDDPFAEPNVVFRGTGDGSYAEVLPRGGTLPEAIATSRAAAFGDVDGDGGIDVVVQNRDGAAHLFRNQVGGRGNWVAFRVTDGGRDALGAAVYVDAGGRRLRRDVRAAYSYCASSDPRAHVGLGSAAVAEDVVVHWVDGAVEAFGDFDAGAVVDLVRGAGESR